jgi:hypothetical protein
VVRALSGAVSIASAVAGVTLMVALGGRLRDLIYRSRRLAKRRERIERVWKRYGIPGLALQAPLLTGPLLATLLTLALGAPPRPCCCGCSPAWCSGGLPSPEPRGLASRYSGSSELPRTSARSFRKASTRLGDEDRGGILTNPRRTGHDLIRAPAGRIAGDYPETGGGSRGGSDLGLGSTEVNRVSS